MMLDELNIFSILLFVSIQLDLNSSQKPCELNQVTLIDSLSKKSKR